MKIKYICAECGEPLRANYREPKENNCGDVTDIYLFVHPCPCQKGDDK